MKCSVGISNCLEEISSLSHSIIFLNFFALITEDCYPAILSLSCLFFFFFYFNSYVFSSSHACWCMRVQQLRMSAETDTFKFQYWRRLFRVLWTSRRSVQSIQKEINPEYLLEGLLLKLKLQYFDHLMWGTDSLEKPCCRETLRTEGEGSNREWNGWMTSLTQWIWIWADSGR